MTSIGARPPRLREKVKAIISSTMLCCGRRKEARESVETQTEGGQAIATSSGYRRGHHHHHHHGGAGPSGRGGRMPEMVVQGDFRKVSGISTEIFRQIEAVENDFDPAGAGQLMEAVEKRGEMIIRLLDPGSLGRAGADVCKRYLQAASDSHHVVQFVEIIKRPGQTLGLYIREGESSAQLMGTHGPEGYGIGMSGVFISRIALESAVYDSGLLRVGDEILAVNLVDVRRMSLDDVVIIMSIPRRLVLTIRSRISGVTSGRSGRGSSRKSGGMGMVEEIHRPPPVVVLKRELLDEEPPEEINSNENGQLMRARTKGLPADMPLVAVPLQHHPQPYQATAAHPVTHPDDRCLLYYNSQPPPGSRKTPPSMGRSPMDHDEDDETTRWYAAQPYQQDNRTMVVTRQPKGHQQDQLRYAKTLETLAEQVHSFYPGHPPPPNSGPPSHAPPPPPLAIGTGGSGFPRQRYWEEHGSLLRRSGQLPRAESDQRIPLLGGSGDLGAFDRYGTVGARTLRTSLRGPSTMQARGRVNRRFDDGTVTLPARQHQGILRRRAAPSMESASDTEATTGPCRDAWLRRQHTLGSRGLTSATRASQQSRSNSLPRARVSDHDYRRQKQPAAGVRFEPRSSALQAYYDSQDESDGAVSAPELPSTRSYRHAHRNRGGVSRASATIGSVGMLRHSPSVFTSAEYRAWMSRAPSTSAIYEKVRRSQRFPQPLKSRIAHSAESLLDSIRQENRLQQFQRGFYPSSSLLRSSSLYGDYEQHQRQLGSVYGSLDYFRRQMGLQGLASGIAPTSSGSTGTVGAGAVVPHPTPVKPSEDRLHLLTLNPREFFRYKPERDSEAVLQADGFSGLLWVHLLAGRGLRSTAAASSGSAAGGGGDPQKEHFRDLYCVIECDRAHKARTVVRTGDHSFDWDEVFELDIVEVCEVSFLLYSWDPQFRHKLCYKGTIHLLTILRESPSHSVALKLEPRGTLYLKLRYRDPRQTFQRLPATPPAVTGGGALPPSTPYFGVDLETVVTREGSPSGVPVLVRRCVEEVEKRGLDVVAIYRLCGSAVRKKTLREALERDPKGVDLSSDHVPDINVITSLLKDYLRELPEPLFAKGLFDMLVDGLSVCLPEDPEGNAKLMFSILECLPKINRCAVLFLMDHLKLVSSRSSRNKMTSQHLAVCFGPILMCHTESGGAPVANIRKPIEICRYLLDIWPAKRATMVVGEGGVAPSVTVNTSALPPLESSRLTSTVLRSTSDKNINAAGGAPGHPSSVGLSGHSGGVSVVGSGPVSVSLSGPIPPEKKAVAWGPVTGVSSIGSVTVPTSTGTSGMVPRSLPESSC